MRRLVILLSMPPPNMRWFAVSGAILIGSYLALRPFADVLDRFGINYFVLANVIFLAGLTFRNLPSAAKTAQTLGVRDWVLGFAVGTTLIGAAIFLLLDDPIWPQRLWTVLPAFRIASLGFGAFFRPGYLGEIPWLGRSLTTGRINAARWDIVGCLMLIMINETAIMYGTLDDWIIARVLAHPAVYALIWWTIIASHPLDDDAGKDDPA